MFFGGTPGRFWGAGEEEEGCAGSRLGASRSPFAHFLDGRHHPLDIILRPAPGLGPHRAARHAAGGAGEGGEGKGGLGGGECGAASVRPSSPSLRLSARPPARTMLPQLGAARLRPPTGPAHCARAPGAAAIAGGCPRRGGMAP